MRKTAIVSALRTPVGRIRKSLASVQAHELASLVMKETIFRTGIDAGKIDEVIFSNLAAHEIANMGKYAALEAGIPFEVPAMTIDRRCASSLSAIALADALIRCGDADCILTGGVESDSNRPYVMLQQNSLHSIAPPKFRQGFKPVPDCIGNVPMGLTAETIAKLYGISRTDCDRFAADSHRKAAAAWDKGAFNEQVVPVITKGEKGGEEKTIGMDDIFRRDCTVESLSRLRPAFDPNGVCTAGNSSPQCDGASAVLLMEAEQAKANGLEILGYVSGSASVGVDPKIMGVGPIYAVRKLLNKTGMTLGDFDVIELNEAFAAQSIACIQELNLNPEKVNPNGGAIALGHPGSATGGILVAKMVHELKRRGGGRGLVTFCVGGGQGAAMIIESA